VVTHPVHVSSGRSKAFTLLEMLVVMGILAIMLVALIPAVSSLSKSGGRKGAVSNVMNTLEQARSLAVSSGRATYVVFADQTTPEGYRCKAFIVFQDDANFTPQAITKWNFLPTGIAFRPNSGVLTGQSGSPKVKFVCPGTLGSTALELPFIKFDSSGMAPLPSGGLWIDMFAGFVDNSGQQSFTDKQQQTSGKYDSIVVARFSGRARYVDPYA
jgi:prepilin-type N-terminal cleavage/methylation domain-containing protein